MTDETIQSLEDLRALGALLREMREARALTLEEAEVQTRIRLKFLHAIEAGDFSGLPSAAHAKGFLRNYAQYLQLDANALVARFSELSGEQIAPVTRVTATPRPAAPPPAPPDTASGGAATPAPARPPSPYPTRTSTYVTPSQRVGPAGPVGLGEAGPPNAGTPAAQPHPAYPGLGQGRGQAAPAPMPESARVMRPAHFWQSNVFVIGALVIGYALIVWWASTQLSRVSISEVVPTEPGSEYLQTFAANITAEPTGTFEPTDTPSSGGPFIQFDRVVLSISVEQRTWTRITVDGVVVFEGQAEPGTVLQYEGRESIVVRTGNAAGLIITYNGQKLGPLGKRGEVVERIYTAQGPITPTYTPTVTTTPTGVPTPTPRRTVTPTQEP